MILSDSHEYFVWYYGGVRGIHLSNVINKTDVKIVLWNIIDLGRVSVTSTFSWQRPKRSRGGGGGGSHENLSSSTLSGKIGRWVPPYHQLDGTM